MRTTLDALRQLDDLRLRVSGAEAEALRRGRFDISRLAADFKASVYVSLAAILEYVFRDIGAEIRFEVLSRCATPDVLRPELSAIVAGKAFAAASLAHRNALMERVRLAQGLTLSTDDWPQDGTFNDGRTVDGRSFDAIWATLSMAGNSLPSTLHRTALAEVKELRNQIAHGEQEAVVIGGRKTFQDLFSRIRQVGECVEALDLALDQWLIDRGWSV